MSTKYIFITGGVVSSLGKGIASASLATLLESRGLNVTLLKLDPYINVDPGTMSPFQHGEVFVTHDGAETDLDLGHYERFVRIQLSKRNNPIENINAVSLVVLSEKRLSMICPVISGTALSIAEAKIIRNDETSSFPICSLR